MKQDVLTSAENTGSATATDVDLNLFYYEEYYQ